MWRSKAPDLTSRSGIMVYTAINGPIYLTKLISRGRFVPSDEDNREYWSRRLPYLLDRKSVV